jgi:hypothetical protein
MAVNKFPPGISDADKARYTVFHNAVIKCTKLYNEDPTASKLRDLRAAEKGLADLKTELAEAAPAKKQAKKPASPLFPSRTTAWTYLRDNGWLIGRTKFYEDCREGRLPREKNGKYTRANVEAYAATYCRRVDTGLRVGEEKGTVADQRESVRLEREKVRLQKERRELELIEGKSIPRAEVELMIVGRAVAFLSHLRAMVQMETSDWLHIGEGNQSRAPEVIAAIQDSIDRHIATFARDVEFTVTFAPAGEAPPADDLDDSDE